MTAYICISSQAFLSRYKVLYDSIKRHVPNATTLLYFTGTEATGVGDVVNVAHWLDNPPYPGNDWYNHCYLRPKAILDAFSRGYDKVILLGADTEFFDVPTAAIEALDTHDCFVTMYTYEPFVDNGTLPDDWQINEVGQINADFLGFQRNDSTIKFMHWLDTTLRTKMVVGPRIFLDQAWFAMVFSYLDRVKIMRHHGYNVMNTNVHNRGMHFANGKWMMRNGDPLVLFHYAGLEKGREAQVSKHQNRYTATGELLDFLNHYTSRAL